MANNVLAELMLTGPVLTDGAWGTQLQARGLAIGACPDAWNLTRPECVQEVAQAYVDAGSQVILTNTFGANQFALERHGMVGRVAEINTNGVAISRRAARNQAKVFASIGPSGKILVMGEVSATALTQAFREQAEALAGSGADVLLVETMSDLNEALIALRVAKETGLPVIVSMTYGAGRHRDRTIMGDTPEQVVLALEDAGADGIGANCGYGPVTMLPLVERLRAATRLPLWIKPNAGLPEIVEGKAIYSMTPEEFADAAYGLIQTGADFIGGCCGSTPGHLAALGDLLRNNPQPERKAREKAQESC